MKKLLLLLVALAPGVLLAQTEIKLVKEYATDVRDMDGPVVLNDKIQITVTNADKDHFNVIANNEDLSSAWTTNLTGYNVFCGIFKNKVLVVSEDNAKEFRDQVTYTARLLEGATGKVVLEKVIYDKTLAYEEIPHFSVTADGSTFNLTIVESKTVHKMRVFNSVNHEGVNDIISMSIDERLNVVNTFHPAVKDGNLLTVQYDKAGNLYNSWYINGVVSVFKYLSKAEPVSQVTEAYEIPKRAKAAFRFLPSTKDPNVVYMAASYTDNDNVCKVRISKLNFFTQKSHPIDDDFNKSDLKALEKSFVPVNTKLDKPSDLDSKWLNIVSLSEQNGMLIVFFSSEHITSLISTTPTGSSTHVSNNPSCLLISGYDLDLNHKYYQVMPSSYKLTTVYNFFSKLTCRIKGSMLCIIAPYKGDGLLYSVMEPATGAWKSMTLLEKRKLGNSYAPNVDSTFWYTNSFAVPYIEARGMMKNFKNIALQQFSY